MAIASATSASAPAPGQPLPVLIVGAGISGLLLAQHLARQGVPFRVFERDGDFATRGVGWGLTLHWSLPAVRELLAPELHARLGDTFVDRRGVEAGLTSRFPFYDLSTGERKAATPEVPHAQRIRVTRERLRRLLATGIDIEVRKAVRDVDGGRMSCCCVVVWATRGRAEEYCHVWWESFIPRFFPSSPFVVLMAEARLLTTGRLAV